MPAIKLFAGMARSYRIFFKFLYAIKRLLRQSPCASAPAPV